MALTQNVIDTLANDARRDLDRALTLFERLAVNGGTVKAGGGFGALLQPDRRDTAQFIFFEAGAQFEAFGREAFKIETRKKFSVEPKRAVYIMGGIDRGLSGTMGSASPKQLQSRGRALFGKTGFFGKLELHIGNLQYQRLSQAHKVRNRVAHAGGKASSEFNKILNQLGVPTASRKGVSVGRVLLDYPSNSPITDRNFHRFIAAYRATVDSFHSVI